MKTKSRRRGNRVRCITKFYTKGDAHGVAFMALQYFRRGSRCCAVPGLLLPKIIAQLAPDGGVAEAAECLRLDLADALPRDAHLASNLFQGIGLSVQ